MSYKEEQRKLIKLWEGYLSNENWHQTDDTSLKYIPSLISSCDSDSNTDNHIEPVQKRTRKNIVYFITLFCVQ